jgi:hypothetical protein
LDRISTLIAQKRESGEREREKEENKKEEKEVSESLHILYISSQEQLKNSVAIDQEEGEAGLGKEEYSY